MTDPTIDPPPPPPGMASPTPTPNTPPPTTAPPPVPSGTPEINEDIASLATPQHESPLAALFKTLGALRQLGFAGIGIIFAFNALRTTQVQLLLVPVLAILVAIIALNWWRFTFHIAGDELIVEQGVLSRERKTIPLGRIQAVTIDQRLLHRVFGLVQAQVETAGSSGVELTLAAIDRPRAEALRRIATLHGAQAQNVDLAAAPDGDVIPAPPTAGLPAGDTGEEVVLSRSMGDLLKVALSSNPLVGLGTAVAGIVAFGTEIADLVGIPTDRTEDLAEDVIASPARIAAVVAVFIALFVLGSLIATIVPLHELTLFRTNRGLRSASGLLSRRERVAPRERIQLIASSANPIQRRFGIRTVTLPTAGASTESDQNSSLIRLPGTSTDEEDELRELLLPGAHSTSETPLHHGISTAAIGRWTAWVGIPLAAITVAQLSVFFGWIGLVGLLWLPIAAIGARLNHRSWRWELGPESLDVQHGPITRVRTSMPVRKSQTVRLRRSLFHRRRGLASVRVSSAAGSVIVPHIELSEARRLVDELLYRAETDPRPFM